MPISSSTLSYNCFPINWLSWLSLLAVGSLFLTACGGCKSIQETQRHMINPPIKWRKGPHLALQLPQEWVDKRIEKELKKAKLHAWRPPSIQGVQLPKLHFKIKGITWTIPAYTPSNDLSPKKEGIVEVMIETRVKKQKLFQLKVSATSPLSLDIEKKRLHLNLSTRSLKSLHLSLSKSAKKKVT